MTITHHPTDPTLAAFAAGTLDEGRALVVSTHLVGCAACRGAVRSFERLRGIALEDAVPVPLEDGALQRTLQQISSNDAAQPISPGRDRSEAQPTPLSAYSLGKWRRIAPGLQFRPVAVPAEGTRVFMLKAAPGIRIPHHAHAGLEWTCVLQGAFSHQLGRYGAGDFDEADDTIEHQPVVEAGVECVCLVALQGQIQLKSWMGRLMQPFIRI
jgi:putative transcriptional regulator